MTTERPADGNHASLTVSDIGGIQQAAIEMTPGLTTLAGANATNRTSLLQALNETLGGTMGSVRRGAGDEQAHAELTVNDETCRRTLAQWEGSITRGGSPYTTNSTIVDLYASLLERNEIRRLIESGDSASIDRKLPDLLMAPIDVDAIQAEIEERQQRKRTIENQLEKIEAKKAELPGLEERRREEERTIEELESEIAAKREQITDLDIDRGAAEAAESQLDELETAQEEYRSIEATIERKGRSLEESQQRLGDKRDELTEVEQRIEETSAPDEETIQTLEERRDKVAHVASLLDSLAEASRSLTTTEQTLALPDALRLDEDVTGALDPGAQTIACPTCGSTVERETVHDRIDVIRSSATKHHEKADEIEEQQSKLRSKRQQLEQLQREQQGLENDIQRLEHRIDEAEERISELKHDLEEKQEDIDDLYDRVEEMREHRNRELETLYDEIADLQGERADAEANLDRLESQILEHESTVDEEDALREEKAELEEAIEERRGRISSLEKRVQEEASNHMSALVERLQYDRIEGIRLDRKPSEAPASFSEFELVVARRREDGVVIEERDLATLSESERSLIGLVVALAGYIAHEAADEVPFLLLDSIEQFDSGRINRLLQYVREEVDVTYVIAALLPEDASGITVGHTEIEADSLT
ncbi:archaea-specific SMC-related protein [Halorubellus salinus]|uniref:archaea-specific SMC-related protein n=1 Tax=Halorubellus salinus TaxID=755309 RepID=UPI001D081DDA|nr:archaea-specific SMC-related protein [Halorubellus salinus]